ncbi:hypothetical protein [Bailinhaonella thermotolerans]|uniref:Uncharacterized protein n=1 Tax=Bailinhaonella thermotolerans TaxID=1070861 RepID=A0A3A4A8Y2_9ACTN|nr:hypothetical protein [Bailinhaonella thermotolerans]RJL22714.1 hypothetical protein D5H75_34535 [Bailinhaonella thermotolerans]
MNVIAVIALIAGMLVMLACAFADPQLISRLAGERGDERYDTARAGTADRAVTAGTAPAGPTGR